MLPLVSVPATSLREGLPAHPALVGFLPCVGQLMLLETGHLRKPLGTALKLAGIWPLARVCPNVVLQVSCCREGLHTFGVGADERSLPCVDSSMDIEVLWGVESLSTAGKLALTRPVGDVDLLDVRSEVGREGERPATAGVVTLIWPLFVPPPSVFCFRCCRSASSIQVERRNAIDSSSLALPSHEQLRRLCVHGQ